MKGLKHLTTMAIALTSISAFAKKKTEIDTAVKNFSEFQAIKDATGRMFSGDAVSEYSSTRRTTNIYDTDGLKLLKGKVKIRMKIKEDGSELEMEVKKSNSLGLTKVDFKCKTDLTSGDLTEITSANCKHKKPVARTMADALKELFSKVPASEIVAKVQLKQEKISFQTEPTTGTYIKTTIQATEYPQGYKGIRAKREAGYEYDALEKADFVITLEKDLKSFGASATTAGKSKSEVKLGYDFLENDADKILEASNAGVISK